MKGDLRAIIFLAIIIVSSLTTVDAQVTKTVGTAGNYTTLKTAFDAINAGTLTGTISLQVISSITDNNSAALNASGVGSANYTSVSIYPTATGYTLSGSLVNPLIDLTGATNVTLDGRVNASGSPQALTITNTNLSTNASTIRLRNSAQNNSIQYCTIKGSNTGSGNGVIVISTSVAGTGNDNNLIDNNFITSDAAGRPINAIYSSGTPGRENSNNIISNNNFYDLLSPAFSARDVNISSNSIDFIVSGNSFYETTTIVPTANNNYNVISISTTVSHVISGNYIGGTAPLCGGTAFTVNSSLPHYLYGIYLTGGTTTPVTVQNNVIKNINYTTTNANPWDGIYIASGVFNSNIIGNTIGASTGTGSIVVTTPNAAATTTISGGVVTAINLVGGGSGFTTAPFVTFTASGSTTTATATAIVSGGIVTGFTLIGGGAGYTSAPQVLFNNAGYSTTHGIRHLSTGTVTISNNNISSITTVGNNAYAHGLESIVISGTSATITITNNLIGSLTTANSLQTSSDAAAALMKQDMRGIYVNSSVTVATITGNTIANLTDNYLGTSTSKLDGICPTGGSNIIQNNIVRNLSTPGVSVGVKGIQQAVTTAGTNQTVTGNTVYNLSSTNASAALVNIQGIQFQSPTSGTNNVSGNFVYSLSMASTNILSEIDGIAVGNGVTTCANNIVTLGSTVAAGYKVYGIYDFSSGIIANNNNVYFNTIYIGGTVAAGTTSPTAALWSVNNGSIRKYKNNILSNARSGGATGKHYAARIAGNSGLTIDYNDYFVSGTGGMLGSIGGVDRTTLAQWKTGTGQDVNSAAADPLFTTAGGTNPLNYMLGNTTLNGITIVGITTDYSGITRGTTPKMGALETKDYGWQGGTSTDFATASNWLNGVVPAANADIIFAVAPSNNCVLDQDRNVGKITNTQSTYKLVTNGFQLSISDSLKFTNGAQINAGAVSSIVKFNGTTAQFIPAGAFVSNTVDGLTVNNGNGVRLNGDLTIGQVLLLSTGNLSIGPGVLFTMAAGSSVSPVGGSPSSFVDGPMIKAGTTAFVFPLGNGGQWARLGMGAPTSSTSFQGQYFAQGEASISTMATTPVPVLTNVSKLEYWMLNRTVGTGTATVTLFWEDAARSGISDCLNLRIAHRNAGASTWENNNDAVTTLGSCSGAAAGSISTTTVVTSFSPFAFGTLLSTGNALPVGLVSLSAAAAGGDVVVTWKTESELNNDHFTIEKSESAIDFYSIGNVNGAGTSAMEHNYSFLDRAPDQGVNYYRLRQTDFNGKTSLSKIVAVDVKRTDPMNVEIYPNPFTSKINLTNESGSEDYLLTNTLGQTLWKGSNIHQTDFSTLEPGLYFLRIATQNIVRSIKLVKQ